MAYRRKIIDRRTREGKALGRKIDTFQAFGSLGLLVFIGGCFLLGRGHSDQPNGSDGQSALISPAQAAPSLQAVAGSMTASNRPLPSGYANNQVYSGSSAMASSSYALGSLPSSASSSGNDTGAGRQVVPWRHVTASGVRWSLRRISPTAMLLVIDLGGEQVADISVAPAFESLELAGMNARVDHVRFVIGQQFALQTANYTYDRDGIVRLIP